MNRLVAALRSPVVKWAFLAIALGLGVWAVVSERSEIADALSRLSWQHVVIAAVTAVAYVWCTMLSWRQVLADLGSPLPWRASVELFGVSQIGKYIPGGVWNIVAAAEIGTAHRIPRRRSVTAMAITVLVSLVSGLAIGAVAFALSPSEDLKRWWWLVLLTPPLVIALAPPAMNRLIAFVLRVVRRPALEHPLTLRGLGGATAWAVVAWLLAGVHVDALASGIGARADARTLALAVTGYALAWVAGYVFIFAPAGVGAREVVLGATLAGAGMTTGAVLAVVLLSRFLLTGVDLLLAGIGLAIRRRD